MGNQASKSKHKVQISADDAAGNLAALYSAAAGSASDDRHRHSLPVSERQQQRRPQQQAIHKPAARPHSLMAPAVSDLPRHSIGPVMSAGQEVNKKQQQQKPTRMATDRDRPHSLMAPAVSDLPRHSIGPVMSAGQEVKKQQQLAMANSTMTADIELVLSQLIEKKPKYGLLRQLDFSQLDERARFVVFEAACDLLDQAKTIDSLREERQLMRSNLNVVRRVASIDHLDNPRHRRVASQELASCIHQELQRRPPRLASPAEAAAGSEAAAADTKKSDRLLGDLIRAYLLLEKQFLEQTRIELLSRRDLFPDSVAACRATHKLLAAMLEAAESLHRRRVEELVDSVTSPTDARGIKVLRARLKLPTDESKAIRTAAGRLLGQASDLCQLPWDSLVDAQQFPAFKRAPSNVAGFLGNCAAWCWRAVCCSSLGRVALGCVEEGGPFRQELHRAELGPGVGRTVACCLWPILYQSRTVICKALVQTAPSGQQQRPLAL